MPMVRTKKILALDVAYKGSQYKGVGIVFSEWTQGEPSEVIEIKGRNNAPYIPGEFWKKEVPILKELCKNLDQIKTIIVDGFLEVLDDRTEELNSSFYEHLMKELKGWKGQVIGIAKSDFGETGKKGYALRWERGGKPLWIQWKNGKDPTKNLKEMKGDKRLPDLLQFLDDKTKEN